MRFGGLRIKFEKYTFLPKIHFRGRPPTFWTSFFRAFFPVRSQDRFRAHFGESDPSKSCWRLRNNHIFTKSRFSLPDTFWSQNGIILGGPTPLKNSRGGQTAILGAPSQILKMHFWRQKSIWGAKRERRS